MSNDIVSIVVPVFNREILVNETIESVLQQDYVHWELILVDDGSTDRTLEVLENFSKLDQRIKVYQRTRTPKGAPTCRNIGIEKSRGKYIIFLDSDDLLAPFCLLQRVDYISNKKTDVASFLQLLFVKEKNDDLTLVNVKNNVDLLERFLQITNETDVPWANSVIWNKDVISKHHLEWDTNLCRYQDIDFNLNIFWKRLTVSFADLPPDSYWRHDDNHATIGKEAYSEKRFVSNYYFLKKIVFNLKKLDVSPRLYLYKMRSNLYFLLYEPSLRHKHYRAAFKSIVLGRKLNLLSFTKSFVLLLQLFLHLVIISDRLRYMTLKKYTHYFLKSILEPLPGNFKKHQYYKV